MSQKSAVLQYNMMFYLTIFRCDYTDMDAIPHLLWRIVLFEWKLTKFTVYCCLQCVHCICCTSIFFLNRLSQIFMSSFRTCGSGAHYKQETTVEEESWGTKVQILKRFTIVIFLLNSCCDKFCNTKCLSCFELVYLKR